MQVMWRFRCSLVVSVMARVSARSLGKDMLAAWIVVLLVKYYSLGISYVSTYYCGRHKLSINHNTFYTRLRSIFHHRCLWRPEAIGFFVEGASAYGLYGAACALAPQNAHGRPKVSESWQDKRLTAEPLSQCIYLKMT